MRQISNGQNDKNIDKIDTLCTIYPIFETVAFFCQKPMDKIKLLPSLNKENSHGA